MGSLLNDALNVVTGVGKGIGDLVSGNPGQALNDVTSTLPSVADGAINGLMTAINPAGAIAGDIGQVLGLGGVGGGLGNLLGIGAAGQAPGLFSGAQGMLGGMFGNIGQILGNLFGGTGGAAGTGGGAGGSIPSGPGGLPNVGGMISNMQSQLQDNLNFQNQMNQIQQAYGKASAILQMLNDLIKQFIRAING